MAVATYPHVAPDNTNERLHRVQIARAVNYCLSSISDAVLLSVFSTDQFDKTTVTLSDVTGLSVNLTENRNYRFRAVLYVDADGTGGHKYAISGNCTALSVVYQIDSIDNGANAFVINQRCTALDSSGDGAGATTIRTEINGFIRVATLGTLTVQFAQKVANGTSSILAGSYLIVERIANT